MLADEKSLEYFIKCYNLGSISDAYVRFLINFLRGENPPLNELFEKKLSTQTKFQDEIDYRDFEKERREQVIRGLNMFFDESVFDREIKFVFENELKSIISKEEIREIIIKNWKNPLYATKALDIIEEFTKENPIKYMEIITQYKKIDFDRLFVGEIYSILNENNILSTNEKPFELTEEYKQKIISWCYKNLPSVNFKTAFIIKKSGERSTTYKAIYLSYFIKLFNLDLREDIYLDLLSYNYEGNNFDYLETKLTIQKIKNRIIENLKNGSENEAAIISYFYWGSNHDFFELLPFAIERLSDNNIDESVRKAALEFIIKSKDAKKTLEETLNKIDDDFKWQIVEELLKLKSDRVEKYLLRQFSNTNLLSKEKAVKYLIEIQNIAGLRYFTEKIKKRKGILSKMV